MTGEYPSKQKFIEYINTYYPDFFCDLCSIPDILKPFISRNEVVKMLEACYIHDFMYRKDAPHSIKIDGKEYTRSKEFADKLFSYHLEESNVSKIIIISSNIAVKLFGQKYFNAENIKANKYLTFEILKENYLNQY